MSDLSKRLKTNICENPEKLKVVIDKDLYNNKEEVEKALIKFINDVKEYQDSLLMLGVVLDVINFLSQLLYNQIYNEVEGYYDISINEEVKGVLTYLNELKTNNIKLTEFKHQYKTYTY